MIYKGFRFEQVAADLFGGYANSYILETKNSIFIIDGNIESAKELFDQTLDTFSIHEKPIYLLITHGHWDHLGLAYYLKEKYNAIICANKEAEKMMSDIAYHIDHLYDRYVPEYSFSNTIGDIFNKEFSHPVSIDKIIQDGDVFEDEDFSLQVIATPGHCDDELSFYNPQNQLLFSGDTIQGNGYNHHPALYDDKFKLEKSLQIIKQLAPKVIYGGHFYIGEPNMCARFVDTSILFIKIVDKFLDGHPGSFEERVEMFLKEFDYQFSMHTISTLNAHIKKYK